ncbi:MAG: hypothetical protein K0R49_38 [Burkholderiales bacterium]|jgi:hypothetical protein|nr:hypothetical protein [Burkholderiales bacterium]
MFNRILALTILSSFLVSCASWFSNDDSTGKDLNSSTVGSRDSSDFLFGQAEGSPSDIKEDSGVPPVVAKPESAGLAK